MRKGPRVTKDNEEILRNFEDWLAAGEGTGRMEELLAPGNHLLFAGLLLKNFRAAARQAVLDKFLLEARRRGFSDAGSPSAALFFMIDQIADAWSLTASEKINLVGCETNEQFDNLRKAPSQEIPVDTLERAAIVVDIYNVLHAIFGNRSAADGWIRRRNHASLFGGRSALTASLDDGVTMLRAIRRYLWAEAAGN